MELKIKIKSKKLGNIGVGGFKQRMIFAQLFCQLFYEHISSQKLLQLSDLSKKKSYIFHFLGS